MNFLLEPWIRSKFRRFFRKAKRELTPQEQICAEALICLESQLAFSAEVRGMCDYRPGDTIKIRRPQRFMHNQS